MFAEKRAKFEFNFRCPRCKRVLGVDGGSPQAPLLPRLPNMKRVICVHCCDIFLFNIQGQMMSKKFHKLSKTSVFHYVDQISILNLNRIWECD